MLKITPYVFECGNDNVISLFKQCVSMVSGSFIGHMIPLESRDTSNLSKTQITEFYHCSINARIACQVVLLKGEKQKFVKY